MNPTERFSSRWGLVLSVIGIAVGTGNIWRFPRIAAANGGGSFLIPWVFFLFLWSIPLIMAEFAIGKQTRLGTVGAFAKLLGEKYAWMGGFVGLVATAIMFYYAVVAGWCLRYFSTALTGRLLEVTDHTAEWNAFISSGWLPVIFHVLSVSIGAAIIRKGVVHGIERVNRIIIPALLALIIVSAIRAITLPGAVQGLEYLFTPDLKTVLDYRVWLQALTQNAWDTGAGWGLILTYAVYMRKREDIPLNSALIGLGNNSVSLLAAITIFCTVFAIMPGRGEELIRDAGPANTGLTFIWIPQLFNQMAGGRLFAIFFFLALTLAAISSLISMLELTTRILMDMRMSRDRALTLVFTAALVLGIPSALSIEFFINQDWVWGMGLMVSGAFIAMAVISFGADRIRLDQINSSGSDLVIGRWYNWLITYAIPAQVVILVSWWFWQVIKGDPQQWWNPFQTESVGTCLFQWLGAIALLLGLNRYMVGRTLEK